METSLKGFAWITQDPLSVHKDHSAAQAMVPVEAARSATAFHRQLPGFAETPLVSLDHLAGQIGLGGIYAKDESKRLGLNSFKVLGGSFALYKTLQKKLGKSDDDMSFAYLKTAEARKKLGDITFASATDGNHGRGVAWASHQLGFKCVIYVHSQTSQPRIDAIRSLGAEVDVIKGNYDHAVRQLAEDAEKNGWVVISDTSWPGYEEVPTWIMQGYTTLWLEAMKQMEGLGIEKPTHVFVQAGVGALAGATIGFFSSLFPKDGPKCVTVEPDQAACLYKSIKINDGKPHTVEGDLDTIMAGLACGEPSPLAWKILSKETDAFVEVPDWVAARGMRIYGNPLKGDSPVTSGESGAVTLGALYEIMTNPEARKLREHLGLGKDSRVLLVSTEGDTDPNDYRSIVWDGKDPCPAK